MFLFKKKKKTLPEIYDEYVEKLLNSLNPIRGIIPREVYLEYEVCALLCSVVLNLMREYEGGDFDSFSISAEKLTLEKYGVDVSKNETGLITRFDIYASVYYKVKEPRCHYFDAFNKKPDMSISAVAQYYAFGDVITAPDSVSMMGKYPDYSFENWDIEKAKRFGHPFILASDTYMDFVRNCFVTMFPEVTKRGR